MIIGLLYALGLQETVYGYTSLSISNVDIIDDGQRIRIYGVANGAEQVNINFNPSEINPYIENEGYKVTESVVGTIIMSNPTRDFYLSKDETKIFYKLHYISLSILRSCENNKPVGTVTIGRIALFTCLYYSSQGTYSPFTGVIIDNTPVNVNIGGATGILSPSSGQNVLTLSDGKTKIEWTGNLVNYAGLSTPYQYSGLFSGSEFIKLIDSGAYSSQQIYLNSFTDCIGSSRTSLSQLGLISLIISLFKSDTAVRGCADNFNNGLTTSLVDKQSKYITDTNIDGATFTSNALRVDLRTATVFPTFIITLDAYKVGIIELKGDTDIVACPSNKEINSGDTYSTSVSVKNIGSQDGSFYGQLSCVGSSDASGVVGEQYIKAGYIASLPVQVSGVNIQSGTQSNTCTITVIDRKSQKSDTCNFMLYVKYQENIICTPNAVTCQDSNTLKTCNSDGTAFTTTNCEFGCIVLESGEAMCKGEINGVEEECPPIVILKAMPPVIKNNITIPDFICHIKLFFKNLFAGVLSIFTILRWIAVFGVFIFTMLFSKNFLNQIKFVKKSKAGKVISWISAIIIGILMGVLIFKLFWIGLIIFVVLVLIKLFIPFPFK